MMNLYPQQALGKEEMPPMGMAFNSVKEEEMPPLGSDATISVSGSAPLASVGSNDSASKPSTWPSFNVSSSVPTKGLDMRFIGSFVEADKKDVEPSIEDVGGRLLFSVMHMEIGNYDKLKKKNGTIHDVGTDGSFCTLYVMHEKFPATMFRVPLDKCKFVANDSECAQFQIVPAKPWSGRKTKDITARVSFKSLNKHLNKLRLDKREPHHPMPAVTKGVSCKTTLTHGLQNSKLHLKHRPCNEKSCQQRSK